MHIAHNPHDVSRCKQICNNQTELYNHCIVQVEMSAEVIVHPTQQAFSNNNHALPYLVVLCCRLKDDENTPVININKDLWCSIQPRDLGKPKVDMLCLEILRCYNVFKINANPPRPKGWNQAQCLGWLGNNPISEPKEIEYLMKLVEEHKQI